MRACQALFGRKVQGAARKSAGRREKKCKAPPSYGAGFRRSLLTLYVVRRVSVSPKGLFRRPTEGAGACRPPVRPLASPSTPLGHPYGVPPAILAGSPSRLCSAMERVGKRSAQGRQPRRGVGKKSKWWRRSRPPGRQRWKCGEGRAAGGQGWGQPVGSPPGCPRGVPAPVHGPRSAGRSRSDLHISTAGGPTRPPLGACCGVLDWPQTFIPFSAGPARTVPGRPRASERRPSSPAPGPGSIRRARPCRG